MTNLQATIEQAWENRALLQEETTQKAIREVIELLDSGKLRVAEPVENGWQVNECRLSCGRLTSEHKLLP